MSSPVPASIWSALALPVMSSLPAPVDNLARGLSDRSTVSLLTLAKVSLV